MISFHSTLPLGSHGLLLRSQFHEDDPQIFSGSDFSLGPHLAFGLFRIMVYKGVFFTKSNTHIYRFDRYTLGI